MDHKTVPIRLISAVPCSFCKSVNVELRHLGYTNIYSISRNDLASADPVTNGDFVYVIPLHEEKKSDQVPLLTLLKTLQYQPVLGVLPYPPERGDAAVPFCNEFLYWPCDSREMELRLERLAKMLQVRCGMDARERLHEEFLGLNMIGSSPVFGHVLQKITKIAGCSAPVLIQGESGTGKELAARAIHYLGDRRDYPFIPVNCGAIPDSLVENELFGHRQGAFTDAKKNQDGLVCQADGGTLFLDEVQTFSPKGQVVLLRFLQDLQYKSLGSSRNRQADVRIIAASNAKLEELVERGEFRKDLYYRLDIMPITMPPLFQRGNDVLELADYFLNKFSIQYNLPGKKLDHLSVHWLQQYSWPGNVRELENLLHREFLLSDKPYIRIGRKPSPREERRRNMIDRREEHIFQNKMQDAKTEIIRKFEVEYIRRLLSSTNGNITKAAEMAGKERRSLGKLIKKHGIDKTVVNEG